MLSKVRAVFTTAALAVCCAGCAPLYSDTITSFDSGYDASQKIIEDRAHVLAQIKARKLIEANLYPDQTPVLPNDPTLLDFTAVVCASSDSLKDQQGAIGVLGAYKDLLDTANKRPKQDIGSIGKSIGANLGNPDSLKPPAARTDTTAACAKEVKALITMKQEVVPEFAPAAIIGALTAVKGLYDAINTSAILLLGIVDDYVRGERLKKIVIQSQGNGKNDGLVLDSLRVLNEDDTGHQRPICDAMKIAENECHLSALEIVGIGEKWMSLRKPWHIYLAMASTKARYLTDKKFAKDTSKPAPDPARYWYALDKQRDELVAALTDYRTLSETASPGDIAKGMRNANEQLVKLAEGKITAAQAWGLLQDYAKRAQDAQKDYASLTDASKKLGAAIDALK